MSRNSIIINNCAVAIFATASLISGCADRLVSTAKPTKVIADATINLPLATKNNGEVISFSAIESTEFTGEIEWDRNRPIPLGGTITLRAPLQPNRVVGRARLHVTHSHGSDDRVYFQAIMKPVNFSGRMELSIEFGGAVRCRYPVDVVP
jgi:hypothetical protein